MERVSPYELCKRVEGQLQAKLSGLDIPSLSHDTQAIVQTLRQTIIDARLTVQEYTFAETREEQAKAAREAQEYLAQAQKGILAASSHSIFGAVDVAHLSANIEQITDRLK
jgi:hypothetical protein